MIRAELRAKVASACNALISNGFLPESKYEFEIVDPAKKEHGDFSCNFALLASKSAGKPPREIAEKITELLIQEKIFEAVSVAGPGFINFKLSDEFLKGACQTAFELGENVGRLKCENPKKILVEFVSVNPNGPIHCGHGRGAAYGDTLCRVLDAFGHQVSREFYVNDGLNSLQMQLFALSVKAKYREKLGLDYNFPEDGYQGDYIEQVAEQILQEFGEEKKDADLSFWQPYAQELMLELQRKDLERFGVVFDTWFSEQSLYDKGEVDDAIEELKKRGWTYEHEGALWFKTTEFGDDKDRVLIRANGQKTYIASDVAYHRDKLERGFDYLINVWGADHHGYITRTRASIEAMGYEGDRFCVEIIQIVRFMKSGKPVTMSKRAGEMVRLSELMDELGVDVARFFYLMRSHEAHMDFDLDLAKENSERNPVYYAQYAHARICSLLSRAKESGYEGDVQGFRSWTLHEAERDLIIKIWDLAFEVERCASDHQVHRLTAYAIELARAYHNFYDKCRVLDENAQDVSSARLVLCEATVSALRACFKLLGISAPERM